MSKTRERKKRDARSIAVISDLWSDVVKYVRGDPYNFWLPRLFRRGIELLSSWLLTRLPLPTFHNSPRLSFKTDGTKLDQDSIQLETGAAISAFSLSSSSSLHCCPLFFIYFYSPFFSYISLLLPSVLFYPIPLVLYSLLYSSTRFSSQRHREKRSSSSFLCKRAISSRCFI